MDTSNTSDVQLLMDEGRVQITNDASNSFPLPWRRKSDIWQVLWQAGGLG